MLDNVKKVIALGYFDSVHIGHLDVIESGKRLAKNLNASLVVFTFGGNLKKALNVADKSVVFTADERKSVFNSIGVSKVVYANISKEFLSLSGTQFLDLLNADGDVVGYVCGEDYRFGAKGAFDVQFLKDYASNRGQQVYVTPIKTIGGQKVSTTLVKQKLQEGLLEQVSQLLGRNYFIQGVVETGRKVGTALGFPTANVRVSEDKTELKNGVYYGYVILDGIKYDAVINYGAKPTFSVYTKTIEAHFIGFNGDLYGKQITLYFEGYLRDIIKFENEDALKEQLLSDVTMIKDKKL